MFGVKATFFGPWTDSRLSHLTPNIRLIVSGNPNTDESQILGESFPDVISYSPYLSVSLFERGAMRSAEAHLPSYKPYISPGVSASSRIALFREPKQAFSFPPTTEKDKLVELTGIEPVASWLQTRRSPSWATAP
jgi:hypothetical protein